MNIRSRHPNFIIVQGTSYSGSGVVYDYLSGRGDLNDPLQGIEYQLPQMPNGLMALEALTKSAFHPGTIDYVLTQFENISKKLSRSKKYWRYGKGYSSKLPLFEVEIKKFIEEICSAELPMHLHWQQLIQTETPIFYLINKLKNRLSNRKLASSTRLVVSQNDFIFAAQKLHHKLFQRDSINQPTLLNQAGSGWNPVESTKYFLNRKVILVTRDPRDQFAELKQFKKAHGVRGFIDWYNEMQRRLEKINNPEILILRFEDFVNYYKKNIEIVCNHLYLDLNLQSNYEPNLSRNNIGKYQKYLDQKEIDLIESSLSKYINF
jgi:hypothetical protein